MNWNDAYFILSVDRALQARLLCLAWNEVAQVNSDALHMNLTNALTPHGVCLMLDGAGLPVPADISNLLAHA